MNAGAKPRVALLGAGDLALTLAAHLSSHPDLRCVGFFDDTKVGQVVAGLPVLGGLATAKSGFDEGAFDLALMAIGYKHLRFRAKVFHELRAQGVPFARLIHPSCTVAASAVVEEGAVLFPGCIVDEGARIGANSVLNAGCIVAHDTTVGPHAFLGPGVTLAGFVRIEAFCFVGIGTVVIDNITLGEGSQTGGGAVVIDHVEPALLVVGVPARPHVRGASLKSS